MGMDEQNLPAPQEPPKRKRGNPNAATANPSGKRKPPEEPPPEWAAEKAARDLEIAELRAELEKREEVSARKELKAARAERDTALERVAELEAAEAARKAGPTDEGMRLAKELVDRCLAEGL